MCQRISELRKAMGAYAEAFDPAMFSASDAELIVEHAGAIEKMAATIKGLAAARVADTGLWKREGDSSPAHQLARKTGTTVGQAAAALNTARRLKKMPEARAAAKRGELSPAQAAAITRAASADPSAEGRLVAQAGTASLEELRNECGRIKAAAAGNDAEARRRAIHARRYLRHYPDAEGASNLHCRNNPEVIASVMSVLSPRADRLAEEAKARGESEPYEAYLADALAELAADDAVDVPAPVAGSGAGAPGTTTQRRAPLVPAKIITRADFAAILRGFTVGEEVCEICGFGPVAVSAVREMIQAGGFLAAVVTKGVDVVGVAHLGRHPTSHQRTALQWLSPTCAVEGCDELADLECDHNPGWSGTHLTLLEWLEMMCPHHHKLKTFKGWSLVAGRGKRPFVPPDDPRHPNNANANAPPGAA